MAAYYNEHDKFAAQWIRNLITAGHIAPGEVDERSIEDVTPADLKGFTQCHFFAGVAVWSYALRRAGVSDDEPVWTGSCPCQPFSAAGKGNGFADERHLWPAFHYLIEQCRPPIVFGEQVASRDAEPWLDLVQDDLEAMGYTFGAVPFASACVGAPHIRDRLYWAADSEGARLEHGVLVSGKSGQGVYAEPLQSTNGGTGCGLADAAQRGIRALDRESGQSIRREEPFRGYGVSSGLADAESERRAGQHLREGTGRQALGTEDIRAFGGMADADGRNASAEREQCGGQQRQQPQDGGHVQNGPAGPTNGLWRDADWLFCRDGKFRPVEPGTFPLVNGAPSRVGRLRAYGNAINAAQAEIFIRCVMECRP